MFYAQSVLGATTVTKLTSASSEAVLTVGKDRLTRGDLARIGCYNFTAARNLSAILATVEPKSLKHLFDTVAPADLALPHLGVISLAVLGAAFEAKRIGGESPLEAWVRHHAAPDARRPVTTFDTIKRRHAAEEASQKKRERRGRRRSTPPPTTIETGGAEYASM